MYQLDLHDVHARVPRVESSLREDSTRGTRAVRVLPAGWEMVGTGDGEVGVLLWCPETPDSATGGGGARAGASTRPRGAYQPARERRWEDTLHHASDRAEALGEDHRAVLTGSPLAGARTGGREVNFDDRVPTSRTAGEHSTQQADAETTEHDEELDFLFPKAHEPTLLLPPIADKTVRNQLVERAIEIQQEVFSCHKEEGDGEMMDSGPGEMMESAGDEMMLWATCLNRNQRDESVHYWKLDVSTGLVQPLARRPSSPLRFSKKLKSLGCF